MNRRETVLGLLALDVAPFATFAQRQEKVWRVGFLALVSRPVSLESHRIGAFSRRMRELGYIEGKNLVIEWRFADGKPERLPSLAADLVQLKVDVIVTGSNAAVSSAQKATTTTPIVMGNSDDPVADGFVKSLARPGSNITGLTNLYSDLGPKQLEILLNTVPKLSRVAVLVYPAYSSHARLLKKLENAAQKASVEVRSVEARTSAEIDSGFSRMSRENAGAVIIGSAPLFNQQTRQIAELTKKHQLPSISAIREHADAGGLMSYGQNLADNYRHAATYVDKILKGAKPGDLPVELPTKLELVINRKTAGVFGLTIPKELLLRADQVID